MSTTLPRNCTCRFNNRQSNNLVQELHCLDRNPCHCTPRNCTCRKTSIATTLSRNCTVWTMTMSLYATGVSTTMPKNCTCRQSSRTQHEKQKPAKPGATCQCRCRRCNMRHFHCLQSLSLTITGMSTTLSKDWTTQMNLHNRDIIHVEILQL